MVYFQTGQLNVLLRHLNDPGSPRLPNEILSAIDSIKQMPGSISNRSIPAIERGQAEYYNRKSSLGCLLSDICKHLYYRIRITRTKSVVLV